MPRPHRQTEPMRRCHEASEDEEAGPYQPDYQQEHDQHHDARPTCTTQRVGVTWRSLMALRLGEGGRVERQVR